MNTPDEILDAYRDGKLDRDEAVRLLYESRSTNLLHSRIDHDREYRTGAPEVIFGQGKTPGQIIEIAAALIDRGANVLVTRATPETAAAFRGYYPDAVYHDLPALLTWTGHPVAARGRIAVVSAGTSDQPVAEEAALTAEFLGSRVERFYDCGVAGLHRLLDVLQPVRQARVVIAVAGMEGALPSVLAGLVAAPVIALPTSVGYGMNLEGVTTLLAMLNTCANGVSVVNVDNGFGAGYNAHIINTLPSL